MALDDAATIIVVDDDPRISRMLLRYLSREGFTVDTAGDGKEMWSKMALTPPDLVILDVMLPGTDGLSLAREIRSKSDIGIIMLTGKSDSIDTVVGLEVGADDYVTKPFEPRELLARIRSVLRRLQAREVAGLKGEAAGRESLLTFDGWNLDTNARELRSPGGEVMDLSDHEYRLLVLLASNPRQALSRETILKKLSNREWHPEDRSVDVSVAKLRKLIENDPARPRLIRTVRNVGYEFTPGTPGNG